jgi:hypothetical protein
MCVVFMTDYSFSKRQRPVDNETFLLIDFINLKIKSAQSFRDVHNDRVYMRVFIGVSVYKYLCLYYVS